MGQLRCLPVAEYHRRRRARLSTLRRVEIGRPYYWTPEEDAIARDMRRRGKSYGQISLKIPRTPNAIYARLRDYPGDGR